LKFNTKVRYGLRAILEIALEQSENGVFQKDISVRQRISIKYLDTIIASLKAAGLIMNIKGKKSGYRLTREPDKIKVLEIYNAFEPGISIVECMNNNFVCDYSSKCAVRGFWGGLNQMMVTYFENHTLGDIIREHKNINQSSDLIEVQ
jgi:Rrf2 family protein